MCSLAVAAPAATALAFASTPAPGIGECASSPWDLRETSCDRVFVGLD